MTGASGAPLEAAGLEAAGPAAGIRLDDVGVRYPGRREPALAGVSLTVGPGDVVGVAGRTGAGKSTLALVAAGFVPRVVRGTVTGHATTAGIDATTTDAAALAGRVGIVFSTPANQLSASKLTVREELAFGLENLGVPREAMDARIDAVLERLDIGHLADREPFALSGGEQQRVAIASIVAMGTGILVLDEPTAQLDPAGTRGVAELLLAEARAGRAVLVVEHDPVVLGLTDRCLVLDAGLMAAIGPPGAALATRIQEPLGLRPPTIVRLAEVAGLPAELAFDEAAVADALGTRAGAAAPGGSGPGGTTASSAAETPDLDLDWRPSRDLEPVGVAVSGLRHRYPGGIEALRGVDLAIAPGERVAIVGQNGSGKTTLAKHLDGLLRPDAGTVEIGARDIAGVPVHEIAGTVGFVFQNPDDQIFNRTVEREVAFGTRQLRVDPAESQALVERALALVGLADVRSVNPYDLGLSTRKLVALASVLATEPAVLVLDEPTTGQDGPGVERVGAIVDAYGRARRTVIAITHDMEFAARHFTRIVVMCEGTIVADDDPSTVFAPDRTSLLAATGLEPPVSARIGARLGLGSTPTPQALLAALARQR